MVAKALADVVRHGTRVIPKKRDDAGQPGKGGRGVADFPVANGLNVGADLFDHVSLQEAKFEPSAPHVVA